MRCWFVAAFALGSAACAFSQSASLVAPLALPGSASPWREALLPNQTKPRTAFSMVTLDGRRALHVEARASYGNLAHPLGVEVGAGPLWLAWRWRVERFVAGSDLHYKSGDDTAVKVCASFDLPLDRVPFVERQLLRIARTNSAEPLPAATLCYVWDRLLPAPGELDSAFTRRVRYVVLQGAPPATGVWRSERRDLVADFLRAFGDETTQVPRLVAVLVGADADNTKSESQAYVADLTLVR